MVAKLLIFSAVLCCVCHQVASQWDSSTSTTDSTTSGSTTSGGSTTTGASTTTSTGSSSQSQGQWSAQGGNQSSAANDSSQAPVTQFFHQILRGQVWGIRKCKKPKDCGLGLRCDALLNLCVPFNTPILQDFEKPCLNNSDCSGMHQCQAGLCRFCGPKSCRSNLDCCGGSFASAGQHGSFFECLNIEDNEKLALAKQLGRVPQGYQPMPKVAGGKSPEDEFGVESEELLQLGATAQGDAAMYGKRCWARCNVDNDCYNQRTAADIKQSLGCCNGVCTRRQSCVKASPQAIQQIQQLQQQAQIQIQQQQLLSQQQQQVQAQQLQAQQLQAQQLQAHQHVGHQHQQQGAAWGAGGHAQQWNPNAQVQFQPRPQSWQEAQQGQPQQWGQQQGGQQGQQG